MFSKLLFYIRQLKINFPIFTQPAAFFRHDVASRSTKAKQNMQNSLTWLMNCRRLIRESDSFCFSKFIFSLGQFFHPQWIADNASMKLKIKTRKRVKNKCILLSDVWICFLLLALWCQNRNCTQYGALFIFAHNNKFMGDNLCLNLIINDETFKVHQ